MRIEIKPLNDFALAELKKSLKVFQHRGLWTGWVNDSLIIKIMLPLKVDPDIIKFKIEKDLKEKTALKASDYAVSVS
jgi:hypothetical protein